MLPVIVILAVVLGGLALANSASAAKKPAVGPKGASNGKPAGSFTIEVGPIGAPIVSVLAA